MLLLLLRGSTRSTSGGVINLVGLVALHWALVAGVLTLLFNIAPITGGFAIPSWVGGVGNWGVLCAFLLVFFSKSITDAWVLV